jgi:hypothetical protein
LFTAAWRGINHSFIEPKMEGNGKMIKPVDELELIILRIVAALE